MSRVELAFRFLAGFPKSLYVNFKVLPWNQAIHMPIYVSYHTKIGMIYKNSIRIEAKNVYFAMVSFGIRERSEGLVFFNRNYLSIDKNSKLICRGAFAMSKGGCLKLSNGAVMECGDRVTFNANTKVLCVHKIIIGENVRIGWDATLKDGDGHAICDETGNRFNIDRPIIIGNNVWVGSEAALLKGTGIPNNSVVGFRALVTKKFEQDNVIIAGSPAKIVKENIKWISD